MGLMTTVFLSGLGGWNMPFKLLRLRVQGLWSHIQGLKLLRVGVRCKA